MLTLKNSLYTCFLGFLSCLLLSCAESGPQRTAAGSIDGVYLGVKSSRSEFDPPRTYQNTSQTTKGVIIGGVAGGG